MKIVTHLLLFFVLCLSPAWARSAPVDPFVAKDRGVELTLAEGGKALLPICISPEASQLVQDLAAELQHYLLKITGASFEIISGDGTRGIVLGKLDDFSFKGLGSVLEPRDTYDGREAYLIRSEAKRLLLIGRTDLGASHAAFRFLELLGCRWFFPAEEWEIVPSIPRLITSVDEASRPAILARRIWYGYGFFHESSVPPGKMAAKEAYRNWARHNRMASSFQVNAGHAWEEISQQFKSEFEQHPEYYALVDGKRTGPQLCVSNERVRRMAAEYARNYFRKHPAAETVSLEPADGGGHCECSSCQKLGTIPDRVFGLANEVAQMIRPDFPGKQVGLYAYNEHSEPPSFELERNVYVQLTAGFITGKHTFEELVDLWPKRCKNMGFYEYFSVWLWDFDRLPGGRAADVAYLQKQIRRYAEKGATSLDAESGNNWGPHGRGYYLANRLMWDPQANVEVILNDFYEKAFGPGASAMRRYYERLDPGTQPLMSKHLLALAFRDVQDASQLAQGYPEVLQRLDHIKQYLRYVHLRWLLDRETEKARQKPLSQELFTHLFRTRYSFMNHWEAVRQAWIPKAAQELEEPSWISAEPPWIKSGDYKSEETESLFQQGLEYFQPVNITEKSFSLDLRPVRFPTSEAGISSQAFQGGVRYALYSVGGDPVKLQVTTGTIAWYRNRAPASYALLNASGEKVRSGRLPLDGEQHTLELPVPGTGLYFFEFDDSDAGWAMSTQTNQASCIVLRRHKGFSHAGHMQRMYFYVPKGTQQFEYFWSGGPHKLHSPDKRLVREVNSSGEFIKVPVPPGMDGKLWSFTELALGHLWFFNLPNVLAGSAHLMLLPREVIEHDQLSSVTTPVGEN